MKRYIERYLPKEYTQMMTSFANLSSKKHVNQYINQIGDDWQSGKRSSRNSRIRSASDADDRQIKITFVDDVDEEERQSFDIGSQTTLKSLFNDYADRRGVSLRLLRFSYSGSTLFLSSAGHKTPEDLGIENGDEISVHDMSEKPARKTSISSDDSSQACTLKNNSNKSSSRKKKKKLKTTKKKSKPLPRQQQSQDSIKTLEEYKVDHSKRLTKIHDECSDQFKLIRQRLNNLSISRSKPKKKTAKKKSKSTTSLPSVVVNPSKEGVGGKAGRTHYVIQVGETSNLYKSTKPSSSSQLSSPQLPTLDLHGYTSEDALVKLNECLEIWFTAAMEGSYPFVRPAVIICGGGTQTLSEVVEKWIKSNANRVSNAPRSHRLNSSARAA